MENEFTNKGCYFIQKRTLTRPKTCNSFLSRKFSADEIKTLNQKIKSYNINDTN
jgi:hypothetical protein